MIGYLRGSLFQKNVNKIIIDCNGVGYLCLISLWTYDSLPEEGQFFSLYVETLIRENDIRLIGFITQEEHKLYKFLVKVDGIGSKVALAALGALSPSGLLNAIRSRDIKKLTNIPGVGKKTAEKLCLELSEKLGGIGYIDSISDEINNFNVWESDLRSALINLGFKDNVIIPIINKLKIDRPPLTEAIRLSLKALQ